MFVALILLSSIAASTGCAPDPMCFQELWTRAHIVPFVLPKAPQFLLNVIYQNCLSLTPGQLITADDGQYEPSFMWPTKNNTLYTLIMFDPYDVDWSATNHWLAINIPWDNISLGDILVYYFGAIPQRTAGIHQYIVLVYEQPGRQPFNGTVISQRRSTANRDHWDYLGYIKQYNLGDPIAGNFFYAQWTPIVDAIAPHLFLNNNNKFIVPKIQYMCNGFAF